MPGVVGLDQPPEGRLDEVFALANIVENLRAKDKEATVDPEVGILGGRTSLTLTAHIHLNEV